MTAEVASPAPDRALVSTIVGFLEAIGLPVRFEPIDEPCVVPGIVLRAGVIVVDEAQLAYPGDLLHEAGHLAVRTAEARSSPDGLDSPGDEMAAIAWSYAAALHIGIDPAVVFHPAGYKGGSQSILDNFAAGRTFGVPLLAWYGLTRERTPALPVTDETYPKMIRWLRGPG